MAREPRVAVLWGLITTTVAVALTVGIVAAIYLDPDRGAFDRLAIIEKAVDAVVSELDTVKIRPGSDDVQKKKALAQVNTDIDFVFGELDQVRGGDGVKRRRKVIADRLKPLADEVDRMIAAMVLMHEKGDR